MNVYLAGKVDEQAGRWRDWVLGTMFGTPSARHDPEDPIDIQKWVLYEDWPEDWDGDPDEIAVKPWPIERGIVLERHDYVGPYRRVLAKTNWKNAGKWHGVTTGGQHGWMEDGDKRKVCSNALRAIANADLVFAYLNAADPYGTLVELGYAKGIGKFVYLVIDHNAGFSPEDYWFAAAVADEVNWLMPMGSGVFLDQRIWREVSEQDIITTALYDALAVYAAQPPKTKQASAAAPIHLLRDAMASFQQISRWSADPRVRAEAEQMVQRLYAS